MDVEGEKGDAKPVTRESQKNAHSVERLTSKMTTFGAQHFSGKPSLDALMLKFGFGLIWVVWMDADARLGPIQGGMKIFG
jgi:hypothetical protein